MLTYYIVALIVGLVLVVLGAFGIGKDVDAAHDADVQIDFDAAGDIDASVDGEGEFSIAKEISGTDGPWIPFLSLRFWTYLFAGFGLTGVAGSLLGGAWISTLIASVLVGLIAGVSVSLLTHILKKNEASSNIGEQELLGSIGNVTVRIARGNVGRVRMIIKDDIIDMVAKSDSGEDIPEGSEVVIVGLDAGVLKVVQRDRLFEEQPVELMH